ncbi:hypothetical protein Tco_0039146 [Tanacetum coccineum]
MSGELRRGTPGDDIGATPSGISKNIVKATPSRVPEDNVRTPLNGLLLPLGSISKGIYQPLGKEIVDTNLKRPFKEAMKPPLKQRIIEFSGQEFKMPTNSGYHLGRFSSAANLTNVPCQYGACLQSAKRYSNKVPKTVDEMMTRLDDFVRSEEAFASTKLLKGEASEAFKKSIGPVSRREYRFHTRGYGVDRQRNEGRNTFNSRDSLAPYRPQVPYQVPRVDHQGYHHPRVNLNSLTKQPKEILTSELQLNLQPPRPMQLSPKKEN